jgi:hypothetical protein
VTVLKDFKIKSGTRSGHLLSSEYSYHLVVSPFHERDACSLQIGKKRDGGPLNQLTKVDEDR